jgi:hypothetical protein
LRRISQIVIVITVAIAFSVQPKGQSKHSEVGANKKPKIRCSACSISSRLLVSPFQDLQAAPYRLQL